MKKTLFFICGVLLVIVCFGCTVNEHVPDIKQDEVDSIGILENEASYPIDENGSVEVYFAQQLLKKKVAGEAITKVEEGLIDHCFVNGKFGLALVDVKTIGMQKVVSQIYRTIDGGVTWDLLDDQLFFNSGAFNCTNFADKLIISNFASVTQSNIFIIIDVNGNINTVSSEEVTDQFDLSGFYAEMRLSEDDRHIVCNWVKDYNSKEIFYVSEHNGEMSTLSFKLYDRGNDNENKK